MAKAKRDIGQEILEGIRQIKRGKIGRATTVLSVVRWEGSGPLNPIPAETLQQRVNDAAEEARRKK